MNKMSLKLNEEQKAMIVTKTTSTFNQQIPIDNRELLKQFTSYKLIDKKDFWLCVFIAHQVTQLPYSRVEVEVDKNNFNILRQTLFFSAKVPYLDKDDKEIFDNPKLEIIMINYSDSITNEEKLNTSIKKYITTNKEKITGKNQYKDYTIIEN